LTSRELAVELYLFRIKAFILPVFEGVLSPSAVVRQAIEEKPMTAPGIRGGRWHVGNVEPVDADGLYFKFGRTTKTTRSSIDATSLNFVESPFEEAPYTHAILDVPTEVCGIATKSSLAPTPAAMGRHLAQTLEVSKIAQQHGVRFDVTPLSDPAEFLEVLRSAIAIRQFTLTFTKPNPMDKDEDIYGPLTRWAQAADADGGSATLKGKALDEKPLEDLTRSLAATGDDAVAQVQLEPDQRPVRKRLRGGTASVGAGDLDEPDERPRALERLRSLYAYIRGRIAS
jgi:hypothetical protein